MFQPPRVAEVVGQKKRPPTKNSFSEDGLSTRLWKVIRRFQVPFYDDRELAKAYLGHEESEHRQLSSRISELSLQKNS